MRKVVIAGAVLAALSHPVFAQAPGEVPALTMPGANAKASAPEQKSPELAVAISIGATLGSFALAASGSDTGLAIGGIGLILGPSTGQWYSGRIGGLGIASRAASVVLLGYGIALADTGGCEAWYTDAECSQVHTDETNGEYMIYAGLALWAGSTIFDFVMAHHAASNWNREHAVRVAPAVFAASGGQKTPGVALSLTF